jgi:PAS domain S-box-containing protein
VIGKTGVTAPLRGAGTGDAQYRFAVWVLGVSVSFAAMIEVFGISLSLLGYVGYLTRVFLTFLAIGLLCWSSLFVANRVRSRTAVTWLLVSGACLLLLSQGLRLADPFISPALTSFWKTLVGEVCEVSFVVGGIGSLFGLYLSVLETDRVKLRLQRDREALSREIDERRRIEHALGESEVKYRTLVEAFPHAVVIVREGRVVFANPMAARTLRLESPQNLIGADPMQFVAPDDRDRLMGYMRGRLSVGREVPETYEVSLIRTTGARFPAMLNVGMIPFMNGLASQMVVVDLTEQKQAEQALRESENRLRMVLEATSDGFWDFDAATQDTYYSPAWAAMIGYEPVELRKDTGWWLDLMPPEDRELAFTEFQRHAAGESPRYEVEYRMRTVDGRLIWVLSRGRVVERDGQGLPLRMLGTHTNITARKQAEEALHQAYAAVEMRVQERTASLMKANLRLTEEIAERKRTEESLRHSQAQLADAQRIGRMGNWVQDFVTLRLTWSDEIYRIFGIEPQQFDGTQQAFFDRVHPDDRQDIVELARRVYRGEEPYDFEHRIVLPDGSERVVHEHAELVVDGRGRPLKLIGTVQDITERKRAQQIVEEHRLRLIEASKMSALGEMAASIAHEINNPLNIISGSAEQLQRVLETPELGPDIPPRLAESIMRHVFRIKKIVHGLRNFTRDSSQDPFQETRTKVIIEDTIVLCQDRFRSHGITLSVADVPDELVVECRPTQLMEVLVNLLNNALHAVEEGTARNVAVTVEDVGESIVVDVTDSGPGVDPSIEERLFEPLVTTKQPGKGTGLGLSISKRIIESHHGTISYARVDGQTHFKISLPKRQGRQAQGTTA